MVADQQLAGNLQFQKSLTQQGIGSGFPSVGQVSRDDTQVCITVMYVDIPYAGFQSLSRIKAQEPLPRGEPGGYR